MLHKKQNLNIGISLAAKFLFVCLLFVSNPVLAQNLDSDEYFVLAKKEGNEKKNFAKAADYCEKALAQAPLDMDIKEYLGKCYMELGRDMQARVVLMDVLEKSPERTDARHYLINIETRAKRYSSAVCYVNELLEVTPYSKTLWMRKINLYNQMGNRVEANRSVRRLYQIFPNDKDVKDMYNNVLKEDAMQQGKSGDVAAAAKGYERSIEVAPKDVEAYTNLINLQIRSGQYNAALATADKGLNNLPNNAELLNKKISVLQELHEYQKAIDIVNAQLKKGPSDYYSKLLVYLTAEAARYYKNSDPYQLYGQLYERDKGNKEAHDYLLNTAISRGYFGDAQQMLTRDLRANPNSKELLSKQLYVYEAQGNAQGARGTVEKLYKLYPNDSDIKAKYDYAVFNEAKVNFVEGNYKGALPVFQRLASHPDYGKSANNYIFSIYQEKGEYDKALEQVNKLIRQYPKEDDYILKKIDLLADMKNFEEAFEMANSYKTRFPENQDFGYMLNDLSIDYIKYLNEREEYETVKMVADNLIQNDPNNELAYNYAIGARISMGEFEDAANLITEARERFPDSRELSLKEAGVYTEARQYDKAVEVLRELYKENPYNANIKGSLIETMMLAAKQKEEQQEYLDAMDIYREVLMIKPKDNVAPFKLANLHIQRKEYPEAMKVVDQALKQSPYDNDLLFLKGTIYEEMGNYEMARRYQGKYIPPAHKLAEHQDHLSYLDARMMRNEIALSYLDVSTDSIPLNTSVATIEYMRFGKKDNFTARVNYAARNTGVGIQGEIDWYHKFNNKGYTLANAGISNQFFQKYKLGLSYYAPLKNSWTGEIGARYAMMSDDRSLITGILGAERNYERFWINGRISVLKDPDEFYYSALVQSRFYMTNGRDYALAMASVGTAPEDLRFDFQTNQFLSFLNTMVGAGYFYNASHRTVFGIMGNWYNYRITEEFYVNQYNLLLTVRTRF